MAWDFNEYYKENRDRILQRRRERYQRDKQYRTDAKQRARDYYDEKLRTTEPANRTQVVTRTGATYYTIKKLADEIKRRPDTIRDYHKMGVLPKPTVRNPHGWRLYTAGQVQLLKRAFELLESGQIRNLAHLGELVAKKWRAYGGNNPKAES